MAVSYKRGNPVWVETNRGYLLDFKGVGTAEGGMRFLVEDAIVWDLHEDGDRYNPNPGP